MPSLDWIQELKVTDLKEELKNRGQPVAGKKAELIARLEAYVKENEGSEPPKPEAEGPAAPSAEQASPPTEEPQATTSIAAEEKEKEPKPDKPASKLEAEPEPMEAEPSEKLSIENKPAKVTPPLDLPDVPQEQAPPRPPAAPQATEAVDADIDLDYGDSDDDEAKHAQQEGPSPEKSSAAAAAEKKEESSAKPAAAPEAETAPSHPAEKSPRSGLFGAAMASIKKPSEKAKAEPPPPTKTSKEHPKEHPAAAPSKPAQDQTKKRPSRDAPGPSEEPSTTRREKQPRREDIKPTPAPAAAQKTQAPAAAAGAAAAGASKAPPAKGPITRALLIEGFVRPFTLNAARDLLGKSGTVLAMWMPNIKNMCWVIFKTKAEAEAAREALWDLRWPSSSNKVLKPRFIKVMEAEHAIGSGGGNPDFKVERTDEDEEDQEVEPGTLQSSSVKKAGNGRGNNASELATFTVRMDEGPPKAGRDIKDKPLRQGRGALAPGAGDGQQGGEDIGGPVGVKDLRELLSRRPKAGGSGGLGGGAGPAAVAGARPSSVADEAEPISLDTLFRKTTARPKIYWMPLSDEAVDLKRKAMAAVQGAPGGSRRNAA